MGAPLLCSGAQSLKKKRTDLLETLDIVYLNSCA